MDLQRKYDSLRPYVLNGSVGLFRGSKTLAKTIQWADDAYYNHSALIFNAGGRLMVLDANAPGVRPDFLSQRINDYVDFCFLLPTGYGEKEVSGAVDLVINKDLSINFKYDFTLLPKILISEKLGVKVKHSLNSNRSICSVFTGYHYAKFLLENKWINEAERKNYFTPQDHLRYLSDKWTILN